MTACGTTFEETVIWRLSHLLTHSADCGCCVGLGTRHQVNRVDCFLGPKVRGAVGEAHGAPSWGEDAESGTKGMLRGGLAGMSEADVPGSGSAGAKAGGINTSIPRPAGSGVSKEKPETWLKGPLSLWKA